MLAATRLSDVRRLSNAGRGACQSDPTEFFLTDSAPALYIPRPLASLSRGGCGGVAQLVRAAES